MSNEIIVQCGRCLFRNENNKCENENSPKYEETVDLEDYCDEFDEDYDEEDIELLDGDINESI